MLNLIRRCKARHEQSACSTTAKTAAALGMQAVELTGLRSAAASHRKRFSMYSRLPSSSAEAVGRRSLLLQLLGNATLLSARCCFAASTLMLLLWLLFAGPLHWRIAVGYSFPKAAAAVYESTIFDGMLLRDFVSLWLVPAALALSAVAVRVLQPVVQQQQRPGVLAAKGAGGAQWMARLVPPRCLWQWLYGGLTVQDLLLIFLWAAINISWFTAAFNYYQHKATLKAVANGLSSATGPQFTKELARSFGATLAPNLVLLLYPISRGSVVMQALGVSYPAGIRYHRWLGYGTLTLVALHGLTYHTVWLVSGQWTAKALEQGSGHNNLLGSVACVFALALWVTSLDVTRRNNFQIFKTVHHIGFWGFLVCGVCHKWDLIWGFVPGLVLYGIDAVYRICQAVQQPASSTDGSGSVSSTAPRVLHASVSPTGGLCTLVVSNPGYAAAASGYLWLAVPAISTWQYHPFEYIAVPWPPGGEANSTGLLLHIKAYSRWTRQLASLVAAKGEKISVKIQGPYCELPSAVLGHREVPPPVTSSHTAYGIVIIAGGNGITSAAGVLLELAAAATTPGLPCLLVWASRSAEELELLAPMVLAMAQSLQLQLTARFFLTGTLPAASDVGHLSVMHRSQQYCSDGASPADMHIDLSDVQDSTKQQQQQQHGWEAGEAGAAGGLVTSSMCPVVALGSWWWQAGHKTVMHTVVFAGAFCALALGQHIQHTQTALLGSRWPTAKAGATYTLLLVVFVTIPGILVLWGSLLLLKLQQKAQHKYSKISSSTEEPIAADGQYISSAAGGGVKTGSGAATAAAAAAVAASVSGGTAKLVTAADGGLQLQLPAVQKQQRDSGTACTEPSSTAAGSEAVQLLQQPCNSAWTIQHYKSSTALAVELGRPPLQQLVKSWLATQQQLATHDHHSSSSSRSRKRSYTVYAMGPEQLVQRVQRLCCDVACLNFVRMTHQL